MTKPKVKAPAKRRASSNAVVLTPAGAVVAEAPRNATPAEILNMPAAQNARVMQAWGGVGDVELSDIRNELVESTKKVFRGDQNKLKSLLFGQAVALQAIFTRLAGMAARADYLPQLEPQLRLALKAQSQSRATLETLAMVMNPPVVYARQANFANGHQQVNNGAAVLGDGAGAPRQQSQHTQLLEDTHGERMDVGAAAAPVAADSPLEAVGAVDRPTHRRGQGADGHERVQGRQAQGRARDAQAAEAGPRPASRRTRTAARR